MKLYRCKTFYVSGLANEPAPRWPRDYNEPEEIAQQGEGEEALSNAFSQSHYTGNGMKVGDVVALDSGKLFRCEMSGWKELPEKQWISRIWRGRGRSRG
jgi:hypothetical protein